MAVIITCPSRMQEPGPWQRQAGLDKWESRWEPGKKNPCVSRWEGGKEIVESWKVGWELHWPTPPLACSFCGSSRWEDVVRLVADGWEAERAKIYKFYLNPPGYHEHIRKLLQAIRTHGKHIGDEVGSPTPPVKVYTYHLSDTQVVIANKWLAAAEREGE